MTTNKLTNSVIKNEFLNKPQDKIRLYKVPAVKNLYLKVSQKGLCSFIFRYLDKNTNKETTIILGYFPSMAIDEAKAKAINMQSERDSGEVNPNLIKKVESNKKKYINDLLDEYVNSKVLKFKPKTQPTQLHSVKQIRDALGAFPITILTAEIIKTRLLDGFEKRECFAQARRLKLIMNWIMNYAEEHEYVTKNPVKLIKEVYWTPEHALKNNNYLDEDKLKPLLKSIYSDNIPNRVKYQLHLLLLLGIRRGEFLNLKFEDIITDKSTNQMCININQTKVNSINVLPLSKQAILLLNKLKTHSKNGYVVVTAKGISPKSENYFIDFLNEMSINLGQSIENRVTPHDFRRAFVNIANESEKFLPHVIELCVGHEIRSKVSKHYSVKPRYIESKYGVFKWWGDFVDECLVDLGFNLENIYNLDC
ncbi:MAG: DUF4102 domain-containing protein [Neisseriales bacterium]|nr:MAG: DUF4102 domain-containing protein [Neisseriales bacterium]